jgi:hypothetical protein
MTTNRHRIDAKTSEGEEIGIDDYLHAGNASRELMREHL